MRLSAGSALIGFCILWPAALAAPALSSSRGLEPRGAGQSAQASNQDANANTNQRGSDSRGGSPGSNTPASVEEHNSSAASTSFENIVKSRWQETLRRLLDAKTNKALSGAQQQEAKEAIKQFLEQAKIQFDYEYAKNPMLNRRFPTYQSTIENLQWTLDHMQNLSVDEMIWLQSYIEDIDLVFQPESAALHKLEIVQLCESHLNELTETWRGIIWEVDNAFVFTVNPQDKRKQKDVIHQFSQRISDIYRTEAQLVEDAVPPLPSTGAWQSLASWAIRAENLKALRGHRYIQVNRAFHMLKEDAAKIASPGVFPIASFDQE